jgi:hypothetical protein
MSVPFWNWSKTIMHSWRTFWFRFFFWPSDSLWCCRDGICHPVSDSEVFKICASAFCISYEGRKDRIRFCPKWYPIPYILQCFDSSSIGPVLKQCTIKRIGCHLRRTLNVRVRLLLHKPPKYWGVLFQGWEWCVKQEKNLYIRKGSFLCDRCEEPVILVHYRLLVAVKVW